MAITCPPNCIQGTPLWELYDITDSNPEFCLYGSIVSEFTDIAGFPVLYYRAKSKLDRLYGEDANQNYYEPVKTKLYYEPTEEPNIIDGMGIRSDETLEYSLIPKATWSRDVGGTIQGVPVTIQNASGGTSYSPGDLRPTTGGTGTGLLVDIDTASGVITKVSVNRFNSGEGYSVGDVITVTGGDENATFEIATTTTKEVGPMAGDVIKTLWNNRNYEIVDLGAEQSIFNGRKLVWEFILRPYRFSEQSLLAEEIHRSSVGWVQIYIYPDGEFADVTYPDGTQVMAVPIGDLDIDLSVLACGSAYNRNEDGSFDLLQPQLEVEEEYFPHPTYEETGKPLETKGTEVYGDNAWIEVESDKIDNYGDLDSIMFSNKSTVPLSYGTSSNESLIQSDVSGFDVVNVLDGESYILQYTVDAEYLYIVVPVNVNAFVFTINGLEVEFVGATGNYLMSGESYTCNTYRSEYTINGSIVVHLTPVG